MFKKKKYLDYDASCMNLLLILPVDLVEVILGSLRVHRLYFQNHGLGHLKYSRG